MTSRHESVISEVIFDIDGKEAQVKDFEKQVIREDFWNEPDNAREVLKEKTRLEDTIATWRKQDSMLDDVMLLFEIASEETVKS